MSHRATLFNVIAISTLAGRVLDVLATDVRATHAGAAADVPREPLNHVPAQCIARL